MKALVLASALALVSPAALALGDWNCGLVNGQNMDIYAGPALAINGVRNELKMYHNDSNSSFYVTADGQYIWGGNARATAVYNSNRQLLANCKSTRDDGKSFWDRLFEDNGYGGVRGDEFIP